MMKKIITLIALVAFTGNLVAQNVGIGTEKPFEKLHVAGNIKADTVKPNALRFSKNAGAGKILTSDDLGNASWQKNNSVASQTNNSAVAGNLGYGVWGDCGTNGNISDYYPVTDSTGAEGDNFGSSVSISGNYAIVGAPNDNVGSNASQGSASIFQYNGATWVLMQKITDAGGAANDEFGTSVSISGNYVIVGAPGDDVGSFTNQGTANIFQYNGTTWVHKQKIADASGVAGDEFGTSVSISGNYALVGAPLDDVSFTDQGSITFFQLSGVSWTITTKKTDATGAANAKFGFSVSISGSYAIAGAPYDDGNNGSASIYRYNNLISGGGWYLMNKLTPYVPTIDPGDDKFGYSVSISGGYAIVGAPFDNISLDQGTSVYPDLGSVNVYRLNGSIYTGSWVLTQIISNPAGVKDDYFGFSVTISGDYFIVGAPYDELPEHNSKTNLGSASIYQRAGLGWQKLQYITDPGGHPNNHFGNGVAIDNASKRFLIGVPNYGSAGITSFSSIGKAVFGVIN